MRTAIRLIIALAIAATISVAGIWAYLANIHGQSTGLIVLFVISMPVAALASLWGFFDSDAIYWLSVIAGGLLWFWIGNMAMGVIARRL